MRRDAGSVLVMDGRAFLAHRRSASDLMGIPVIVMTASRSFERRIVEPKPELRSDQADEVPPHPLLSLVRGRGHAGLARLLRTSHPTAGSSERLPASPDRRRSSDRRRSGTEG